MENQSLQNWPGYEPVAKEENPFFMQDTQQLDLSGCALSNWPCEFPLEENVIEMESFLHENPLYPSMEFLPDHNMFQDDFCYELDRGFGIWDDMSIGFEVEPRKEIVLYSGDDGEELKEKKAERCREEKTITFNELSRYFYMPITQAAKELNVGLTLLKKRCRELGIPRWPHRKMKSLQTLIKNVQQLGKEDEEVDETQLRTAVEMLEQQRKLMEKVPAIEMGEKTKKLRQACFKANYKKKRLMGVVESQASPTYLCMENTEQLN
ncbi:protein RKD3-like [Tasmannia lanceolata]|uniref:protein RKD3-like n=1 Tax=Tasmannia lanceolata TaxID=3420 RepID=UPI004063A474